MALPLPWWIDGARDSGSELSASHNYDSQSGIRCQKNHWTTVPMTSFPNFGFPELLQYLYFVPESIFGLF